MAYAPFNNTIIQLYSPSHRVIQSLKERRVLQKIRTSLERLNRFMSSVADPSISFNAMVITLDGKVLLLQRTNSFHFSRVKRIVCAHNPINSKWLNSLYPSEIAELPTGTTRSAGSAPIHVFPGGHSKKNEIVIKALLREMFEETSIRFSELELRFCSSFLFRVEIYDPLINKTFENIIFPVKVSLTSTDIANRFTETSDTKNPMFLDYSHRTQTLFDWFTIIQHFMLLK